MKSSIASSRCKLAFATTLFLAAFSASAGAAAIHSYFIDPDLFPVLDQHEIGGVPDPSFGCGPAAAITSLAYLDETHLMPRHFPPRPLHDEMLAAASIIAGGDYMDTAALGTRVPPYIKGINKYLGERLQGTAPYMVTAQMGATWDAAAYGAKPGFVQDGVAPTWQYLLSNLALNSAIQIGVDGLKPDGSRGGHWLTLTGFYFADFGFDDRIDQGVDIAYFRYVDPWSGQTGQADLWMKPGSNIIRTNYVGAAHDGNPELKFDDVRFIAAVTETVPEPGTALLIGLGLAGCVTTRRFKT
jgi:hypothetical protein